MLTINLAAIRENIRILKTAAAPAKFMAVVKNNAYGHGLIEVAQAALEAGSDWLGVIHVSEGVQLRDTGITAPILVLGYVPPEDIPHAVHYRIDIPLINLEHAHKVRSKIPTGKKLRVHLKIETGLNRFGVTSLELLELAQFIGLRSAHSGQNSAFSPIGVYSHLAAVEEVAFGHARLQLDNFDEQTRRLGAHKNGDLLRHIAATAAILMLPESHLDLVRSGIGIYGLWPSAEIARRVDHPTARLQPALEWSEPIAELKKVQANQPVGYGCSWKPIKDATVALIAIGYADGLDRKFSSIGVVEVLDTECPIVGRICTNVTFIDVTHVPRVTVGDEVILLSASQTSPASAQAQADRINTIHYELVSRLPIHIQRSYIQ
ncbi:alanine racemase [Candidatus Berkelbacteria bacterium]|nr:alanine racemase [Candidatus Berkelbacteria bacterium]